ncbi:MAG: APC family permease [Rhodococcus sp. (in: high G+C Gram-positive bacteria)]
MSNMPGTTTPPPDAPSDGTSRRDIRRLQGHLGVMALVFTVLAFNAPLGVMAGFVPFVIGGGNQLGAPITFVVIGVLLAVFAVGLTTMSKFMKSPGAFYVYIAAGLGRAAGLGAAFLAFVAYIGCAAGSSAFGGIVTDALVHGVLGGPSLPWWVWAIAFWVVSTLLSLLQIDISAKVLGVAMCAEVLIVVVWQLFVLLRGGPEGYSPSSFTLPAFTSGSLGFALLFGALCFVGFEATAVFREETRDPAKTIPRATYLAVGFLAVFYGVGAWAYIVAFGPSAAVDAAADPSGSFTASVGQYVNSTAMDLVAVLLVSSVFASVLATQNIAARYLYALGSDQVLPAALARVHPRHGSPYVAALTVAALILAVGAIAAIIGVSPVIVYGTLTGFAGFCLVVLMTLTSVSVIVFFRRTKSHTANVWRSLIAPIVSFAGLLIIVVLAATNMGAIIGGNETAGRLALLLVVALALAGALLAISYKKSRPHIYAAIGQQDV